jgi:hypothetical protein
MDYLSRNPICLVRNGGLLLDNSPVGFMGTGDEEEGSVAVLYRAVVIAFDGHVSFRFGVYGGGGFDSPSGSLVCGGCGGLSEEIL